MNSTIVYRSRSTSPMPPPALADLVGAARQRNRLNHVTGLLVHDDDRFFQWIEGPRETLRPILESISRDGRHCDIDIVLEQEGQARVFNDWNMQLAARESKPLPLGAVGAPDELFQKLHGTGADVPGALAALGSALRGELARAAAPESPLANDNTEQLTRFVREKVVPQLKRIASQRGTDFALPRFALFAERLADLLIRKDPVPAFALIEELCGSFSPAPRACVALFEPTSRLLGDMWARELCSELEVTLALCRMQTALRLHTRMALPKEISGRLSPRVLVVPQPGELHHLGAAMDSEVLWQAGWDVHSDFPDSDSALSEMLARDWYDALDLNLSGAFEHANWLPTVTRTIEHARKNSRNPDLVVVVGGRVFREQAGASASVAADGGSMSSAELAQEIFAVPPSALRNRLTRRRPLRRPATPSPAANDAEDSAASD